jgi:hypothetical protein
MSQENVEVVRRAWETHVSQGVNAVLDYFAEDCVVEAKSSSKYRSSSSTREATSSWR